MYGWIVQHKDGLLVLAAVISPIVSAIVAIIAAAISYRASVTGPQMQRETAEHQMKISRDQLEFQRRQAEATLIGSHNQRWSEKFIGKISELIQCITDIQIAKQAITSDYSNSDLKPEGRNEEKIAVLMSKFNTLIVEVSLMIDDQKVSDNFTTLIRSTLKYNQIDFDLNPEFPVQIVLMAQGIIRDKLGSVKRYLTET